jgi:dimethylhistidine N-methyltransferase
VAVHGHSLGVVDEFVQIDMATYSQVFEQKYTVPLGTCGALIHDVRRGLAKRPRFLSPWMLYDRRGSRLFDRITTLPEYYLTRTERCILGRNTNAIMGAIRAVASQPLRIVELGAGTATKTGILLGTAVRAQSDVVYMPLDVSPDALEIACRSIECSYPTVRVEPRVVDYTTNPPQLDPFHGATLMLSLGSSIGNFSPQEARTILRNASLQMRTKDAFLLGVDFVKDESALVAAYNDHAGVTAAFNLNIVHRLNRELNADFDPDGFRHRARWNSAKSRVEMHLESVREQDVSIAAAQLDLHFAKGETIHTENSYKFTDESLRTLMWDSGFDISKTWKDELAYYAVVLARPRGRL